MTGAAKVKGAISRSSMRKSAKAVRNPAATAAMRRLKETLPQVDTPWSQSKKANTATPASKLRQLAHIKSHDITYEPLEVPGQPPVPVLANELDRVLFNSGVQTLKDGRTNVYNFDERLEHIVSIKDFDFSCVPAYIPAGKDNTLAKLAMENNKKYVGSTSSLTPILTHFHHALSHRRPPQLMGLSKYFPGVTTTFTAAQRAGSSFYLRYNKETGTYSVNSGSVSNDDLILTLLGQVMEVMLVTDYEQFQNYTKSRSHMLTAEQKDATGSTYNYTTCGNFLMRSQLDCHDPRLPGTGMFDLKTRAVCAIRYDIDYAQIQDGSDYQIVKRDGQYESYSREFYELIRSALLKYSLQARIGRMDGIFVAYHNIRSLFGFEYLPLAEIDKIFHTAHLTKGFNPRPSSTVQNHEDLERKIAETGPRIADAEFKLSIRSMESVFDAILDSVPEKYRKETLNTVISCSNPGEILLFIKPMREEHIKGEKSWWDAPINQDLAKYESGADPHPLLLHYRENPDFLPPDVICLKVVFKSFINNVPVAPRDHPDLKTDEDSWEVSLKIARVENCAKLYKEVMSTQVEQQLTSKPITQRTDDEEDLRKQALAKLPEASELQEWLRKLELRGRNYKEWDKNRPRQRWQPVQTL